MAHSCESSRAWGDGDAGSLLPGVLSPELIARVRRHGQTRLRYIVSAPPPPRPQPQPQIHAAREAVRSSTRWSGSTRMKVPSDAEKLSMRPRRGKRSTSRWHCSRLVRTPRKELSLQGTFFSMTTAARSKIPGRSRRSKVKSQRPCSDQVQRSSTSCFERSEWTSTTRTISARCGVPQGGVRLAVRKFQSDRRVRSSGAGARNMGRLIQKKEAQRFGRVSRAGDGNGVAQHHHHLSIDCVAPFDGDMGPTGCSRIRN